MAISKTDRTISSVLGTGFMRAIALLSAACADSGSVFRRLEVGIGDGDPDVTIYVQRSGCTRDRAAREVERVLHPLGFDVKANVEARYGISIDVRDPVGSRVLQGRVSDLYMDEDEEE